MNKRQIIQRARDLRKRQTPSEDLLWRNLRNRKLNGVKFLRQHPVVYENMNGNQKCFYPDFYSAEKKLVVELDGGIHLSQIDYDQYRDAILRKQGLTVLRFKNEELNNMEAVLQKISSHF